MGPLRQMGAQFTAQDGGRMPVHFQGPDTALPITYKLPVASAQVKSAVLLAGLHAPGKTTVIEPVATRDHTENFLSYFGAELSVSKGPEGKEITLTGEPELTPAPITVPADPAVDSAEANRIYRDYGPNELS